MRPGDSAAQVPFGPTRVLAGTCRGVRPTSRCGGVSSVWRPPRRPKRRSGPLLQQRAPH